MRFEIQQDARRSSVGTHADVRACILKANCNRSQNQAAAFFTG